MSSLDRDTRLPFRRLAFGLLIACALYLVLENAVLLGVLATTRPLAAIAVAWAAFRVSCVLCVPIGLVLATGLLGWWWAGRVTSTRRVVPEVHHE